MGEILSIERQSFPNPWSQDMFFALFQIHPKGFYVADKDEEIVGYGIILNEGRLSRLESKKMAHLLNLAVARQYRNQGIGLSILKAMESELKKDSINKIYLEVRVQNKDAVAFYFKLGFRKTRIIERFYEDDDAILMIKDIV